MVHVRREGTCEEGGGAVSCVRPGNVVVEVMVHSYCFTNTRSPVSLSTPCQHQEWPP